MWCLSAAARAPPLCSGPSATRLTGNRSLVQSIVRIYFAGAINRPSVHRQELGFNLNADEAMAMGAVFRAANLSTAFQLRKFGMVDLSPFSVGVRFTDLLQGRGCLALLAYRSCHFCSI